MNADQYQVIEQLYLEMFEKLRAYASCALENESLAEEAVQETFRIACMKPDSLCSSENPHGWLVVVLKNTIRNMKRSRETANRIFTTYVASRSEEVSVSKDGMSLELLYGGIAETDDFKLIKEMAVDGWSHLEMAESRGIKVSTCKKRVQRAKENLKKKIIL